MRSMLWVFLAVLLLALSFPPADLGWLGWIALWPWCRLVSSARGWKLFGWGYLGGLALLGLGCAWLRLSAWFNLVGMLSVESLYYGAFAAVLRLLLVRRGWSAVVALPSAWVAMEFGRRHIPFDGFPWLFLGYTQHSAALPLQVADLGGVFGLGALLAATAGAFHELTAPGRDRRKCVWRAVPAVLLLLASFVYGTVRLGGEEGERGPRVLVVQPNIPQQLKNSIAMTGEEILERHVHWSQVGLRDSEAAVDLVIWPETMLPKWVFAREGSRPADVWTRSIEPPRTAEQGQFVERVLLESEIGPRVLAPEGSWLLAGALIHGGDIDRGDYSEWNSAILYDPSGVRRAVYDKRFLVPGGEYLPIVGSLPDSPRKWIHEQIRGMTGGWLPMLTAGKGSSVMSLEVRSHEATSLEKAEPVPMGVSICFDIAYPSLGREAVEEGAEFLINISNEGWFPESAEFAQYTAMAAIRAAELKRSIVRCANSGTSALIDPYGRVKALEGPVGERDGFAGALTVQPRLRRDRTVYARLGDWPAWGALITTAVLCLWRRRQHG